MQARGQGAIEYLLIIGAAILVVAVVVVALTGVLGSGKTNTTTEPVLDAQLKLLVLSGSGLNEPLNAGAGGTLTKQLTGQLYVNSDSVATTPTSLQNAYEQSIFLILVDSVSAKDLGYTYTTNSTTTAGQIHIAYSGSKYTVTLNPKAGTTPTTVTIQYINYPYGGTQTGFASGSFAPTPSGYKVIEPTGRILLKRN